MSPLSWVVDHFVENKVAEFHHKFNHHSKTRAEAQTPGEGELVT